MPKGQIAWNKGLTKDTDLRIARYAQKLKGRPSWHKGRKRSAEFGKKISLAKMGHSVSEEARLNMRLAQLGKPKLWLRGKILSETHRKNISLAKKGQPCPQLNRKGKPSWSRGLTKETNDSIRKIAEAKIGKPHPVSKEIQENRLREKELKLGISRNELEKLYLDYILIIKEIAKFLETTDGQIYDLLIQYNIPRRTHAETMKLRPDLREVWRDNVVKEGIKNLEKIRNTPELKRKWAESFSRKPNKVEIKLEELLIDNNLPYKYVGDGQVVIGYWNPDFININGKKKLIELFGDYFHKPEEAVPRIKKFAKYGFETLIVWEHELKDEQAVIAKIKAFDAP